MVNVIRSGGGIMSKTFQINYPSSPVHSKPLTNGQRSRLILDIDSAVRTCESVLREAGFHVTRFDQTTLLCSCNKFGSQRLFGIGLSFQRISAELTELSFSEVDTGLGTLHSDLFRRRLIGLQKIIERKAA